MQVSHCVDTEVLQEVDIWGYQKIPGVNIVISGNTKRVQGG